MNADMASIRAACSRFDPSSAHEAVRPPQLDEIYAPSGHDSALDPERSLVVGGRGMGKSFWSGALWNEETRDFLATVYPRLGLGNCTVQLGFAAGDSSGGGFPSQEVLDELIEREHYQPEMIWRAVVWRYATEATGHRVPDTWHEIVASCFYKKAERLQSELRDADEQLHRDKRRLVVIFDALDWMGHDWPAIRERSQALLRVTLALRSYRALKTKIFIRSDQFADEALFAFPDASKVKGAAVDLTWNRCDLYGLAFSRLAADADAAQGFRQLVQNVTGLSIPDMQPISLPSALKDDKEVQQTVFRRIAGPFMGKNHRRGKTYTWLHNHLADAHGQVSPRSFLIALRHAALFRPEPQDLAFDYKGLQAGLQAASETRVNQLGEEYEWIKSVITPLADLHVPGPDDQFIHRWDEAGVINEIRAAQQYRKYLVPVEFLLSPGDPAALLEALRRIGVVERRPDGRINIPDLFRIAAKLLKRGGVPPRR
jgi:hypothetical protein